MIRLLRSIVAAFSIILIMVTSAASKDEGAPADKRAVHSSLPELILPEATVGTFGEVPPAKKPMLKPKLVDSATTLSKALNYREVVARLGIQLSAAQKRFLEEHKFLLIPASATSGNWEPGDPCERPWDEMLLMFDAIGGSSDAMERRPENAILVTPDVVLHAFHKFSENSLKYLEKHDLPVLLRRFVRAAQEKALDYAQQSSGKVSEHYQTVAAQFTVPLILLENAEWPESRDVRPEELPDSNGGKSGRGDRIGTLANAERLLAAYRDTFTSESLEGIRRELVLIYRAKEQAVSPLFGRYSHAEIDYTQFTPRGHYTAHSLLRGFFRAMMYLGRSSYSLGKSSGITDALLVAHVMASPGNDGRPIVSDWRKLMEITGFFSGKSDDIGYPEWRHFVVRTLGTDRLAPAQAVDPVIIERLSHQLVDLRPPRILSGAPVDETTGQRTKEQRLEAGKAFKIFGQRFTVDGWILSRLTGGLEIASCRLPSTPSALFVPAAFGDRTARGFTRDYLKRLDPPFTADEVRRFLTELNAVSRDITEMGDSEWFGSLNSAWLKVLETLTGSFGYGYPLYMQSRVYGVKQLESLLGAYTELKHDTLLYEKQPEAECGGPGQEGEPPPVPKGFVEPNLPFWYSLQRLVRFANEGFRKYGLLQREREEYGHLTLFRKRVDFYTALAEKELRGLGITEAEYEELRCTGLNFMAEPLDAAEPPSDEKDRRSGLIADIHTNKLKRQILYEATGQPYIMLALAGNENSPRLTIGVSYNHYEFVGPLGTRLTDADWQARAYDKPNELPPKDFWYKDLTAK